MMVKRLETATAELRLIYKTNVHVVYANGTVTGTNDCPARLPPGTQFESLELVANLRHGVELFVELSVATRAPRPGHYVSVRRVHEQLLYAVRPVGGGAEKRPQRP